ncbi:nitrile hydratase subunit beta [Nitriliruptor alkaliphilus]|uniref:nitrile hydratase subunit beta n=1 Tax=Nitriliruptor alkaliphilus TaxID=427918 RepID=UPI0006980AE5|nr:nitrile hydratase subunit beta [Nitriliruptor alkaliphilus]
MNGVHDLGGTDGLGPVITEENEPVWHSEWEKAVFTMFPTNFAKGHFNVDSFRFGIEKIHPADYLSSRYYEHWLHSIEHAVVDQGVVDAEELEARTRHYLENPDAPLPDRQDPDLVPLVETISRGGGSARRESDKAPRFEVGDRVRVKRDEVPHGHTRRARYVQGREGVIVQAHGAFIYPDSAGNGGPEDPEHVYTILFEASHLWGERTGDSNGTVTFDAWEPYLELV